MNDDFDNEGTDREMSERFAEKPTHTPPPWEVSSVASDAVCGVGARIYSYVDQRTPSPDITFRTNTILAERLTTENARRVVACVNAMRDVSTAALEELVKEERELELALTLSTMMKSEPSSERSRG